MRERWAAGMMALGVLLCVGAGAGCKQYPPPVPLEQLNAAETAGHQVFEAQCAQCHYDRVDKSRNGPSLRSIFKKPALHSGAAATDERVTATVLHGHGLMPAMGDRVDEQQMANLLAYLHTL